MASKAEVGRTVYSALRDGDAGNHQFGARFDLTDGYLGISQKHGDRWTDRVLLSPAQVKALRTFLAKPAEGA